jgi:hypothetical protein
MSLTSRLLNYVLPPDSPLAQHNEGQITHHDESRLFRSGEGRPSMKKQASTAVEQDSSQDEKSRHPYVHVSTLERLEELLLNDHHVGALERVGLMRLVM